MLTVSFIGGETLLLELKQSECDLFKSWFYNFENSRPHEIINMGKKYLFNKKSIAYIVIE
ncbi:hypothetical protein [Clostridium psychrophilum]|uniref:hypothetical protein n=1 Tax=Clostridium psychrophilum TaxID=132926 RepID=UPI001C0B6F12|nr:hypothetical protein [Clostridium psychrophilum]MBU3181353.1 hypothetical protein [Clostridium psychrophilum]